MSTAPIKTCDHCQQTGIMPTFRDGETICTDCMSKSADMTRGKYLALQAEVERLRELAASQDVLLKATSAELSQLHVDHAAVEKERDQLKVRVVELENFLKTRLKANNNKHADYCGLHFGFGEDGCTCLVGQYSQIINRAHDYSLSAHDAQVIERAAASVDVDDSKIPAEFDVSMCRGYRVGFTHAMCAVEEVAAQLRQQAKEVQS